MNGDRHRARRTARRARRAFTLIEIIVALSAGVLVSMAAFAMSKNATQFFQHEARISTAQLALTLGLNRITADLTRASFLSTPNAKNDPMVCRDSSWGSAPGLLSLAGVTVTPGAAPTASSQAGLNGLTPEALYVGGSLGTAESFTVQCVSSGTSGLQLQLQSPQFDGAMARIFTSLGTGETLQSRLNTVFPGGRYVQIFNPATGYKVYGVLLDTNAVTVAGNVATLQLKSAPAVPTRANAFCGIIVPQCGAGLIVSVVNRVRYDVRSLQGAGTYSALVTPPGGVAGPTALVTGDAGRTELVRVEIDANNTEVASSLELVAEYAVDLRFGITAVTGRVVNDNYDTSVIRTYEVGDPNIYSIAGDVSTGTATPQWVRSVQVRLATRTRAPDRETDLPVGYDGRRLHYKVLTAGKAQYARVRTAYANVSLPNQGGFSLW